MQRSKGKAGEGRGGQPEAAAIARARAEPALLPRYVIEGDEHFNRHGAFVAAKKRGYNGSFATFCLRLSSGPLTWASLAAPVSAYAAAKGVRVAKQAAAKRLTEADEMAAMCAELDRRKAVIEARQVAEEIEE